MTHAVIIGNGVTGTTAARHLRTLEPTWRITVISGESTHHYSRPALMYIFMGHMRYADTKPFEDHVWRDERIDLVRDWVTSIDTAAHTLSLHHGADIHYDRLLIATGSKSNTFGWPGQDLKRVHGLYDLMDLKALYDCAGQVRQAVIVGGGLIGIELGEMLHSRGIHVTFLVRETSYWDNVLPPEESAMVTRLIRQEGFDVRLETELREIIDDGAGAAGGIVTSTDEQIECEFVGLTAGVSPNIDLVREGPIATGRGVLVDWSLRTNVDDVYAAGDCAEIVTEGEQRNLLQQVWYTGKMQGRVAAESMAGRDAVYDPGIWYNSAKFLDLEYQTYGFVPSRPTEGQTHLWWEHASGWKGIRLVIDDAGTFLATNVMGMRYRHEVCERWIAEKRSIEYVLEHLHEANFDTEFFTRHEREIVPALRAQIPATVGGGA